MATSDKKDVKKKPKMAGLTEKSTATKKPVVETKKASANTKKDAVQSVVVSVEQVTKAKALKIIPELLHANANNEFQIGGLLLKVQEEKWWEGDFDSFKQYVEEALGLAYRKSMYIMDIYTTMVEFDISAEQVKDVGWSKLRFIMKLFTEDNIQEWLDRAKEMTSLELQQYVQDMKNAELGENDPDDNKVETSKVTTMTFKVHPDQKETIRTALDMKKEDIGTEFDTVALENIALDMLEGNTGKQKIKEVPAKLTKKTVTTFLTDMGEDKAADLLLSIYPSLGE